MNLLSSNTFGRMQMWTKKYKNGKPYWWYLEKRSSDESYSEADHDSKDETESDDEKDIDKSYE